MTRLYPVKYHEDQPRRQALEDLETRLQQWVINLPDALQYYEGGNKPTPPPHVLIMHMEYHLAVLLLHRSL